MAAPPAADQPSFASPGHVAVSHEASIKLTRGHSCVLCQQRKVRCDKNKPCANCVKAGVDCKVVPPQPPRRRKKKPQERDLIDRLRKYESLLSKHGVDFEPIGHAFRSLDPTSVDDIDDIEHGSESSRLLTPLFPGLLGRCGRGFLWAAIIDASCFYRHEQLIQTLQVEGLKTSPSSTSADIERYVVDMLAVPLLFG